MIDGVSFSKKVDDVLEIYGLSDDDKTRDVVENFMMACVRAKVEINSKIWDSRLINHIWKNKIKSSKLLAIINLTWKQPCLADRLSQISGQQAAPVRDLRKLGFVFRETARRNGEAYQFYMQGQRMREIVGLTKSTVTRKRTGVKDYDLYRIDKRCPFTTEGERLELDHRQPFSACQKLGVDLVELTEDLIKSGEADKHFQFISVSFNALKRERCKKCQNGGQIIIPDSVPKKAYKKSWTDGKGCTGCYYFNSRQPKYPQYFTAENLCQNGGQIIIPDSVPKKVQKNHKKKITRSIDYNIKNGIMTPNKTIRSR